MAQFMLNHLVRLVGLNNADYNDKLARVKSVLDPTRGRHLVTLEGEVVPSTVNRDIHIKPENMLHACEYCHVVKSTTDMPIELKCSRCRIARYCNRDCQRTDWPQHKVNCFVYGVNRDRLKKPLIDAVVRNDLTEVQRLVEQGADVNRAGYNGSTPIRFAADLGYLTIVRYLAQQGADFNKADDVDDTTPLFMAAYNGRKEVVQFLVQQGKDLPPSPPFFSYHPLTCPPSPPPSVSSRR